MSEILLKENGVLLAAVQRMLSLGTEASEKHVAGRQSKKEDDRASAIFKLLIAYRQKANLSDKQRESILYDLLNISETDIEDIQIPPSDDAVDGALLSDGGSAVLWDGGDAIIWQ